MNRRDGGIKFGLSSACHECAVAFKTLGSGMALFRLRRIGAGARAAARAVAAGSANGRLRAMGELRESSRLFLTP